MSKIFAVDQLSFILEKEPVKTIIKIDDHDHEILPRLRKIRRLKKRVVFFIYLKRTGSINQITIPPPPTHKKNAKNTKLNIITITFLAGLFTEIIRTNIF